MLSKRVHNRCMVISTVTPPLAGLCFSHTAQLVDGFEPQSAQSTLEPLITSDLGAHASFATFVPYQLRLDLRSWRRGVCNGVVSFPPHQAISCTLLEYLIWGTFLCSVHVCMRVAPPPQHSRLRSSVYHASISVL